MGKGSKHAKTKLQKWLRSYGDVSGWIEKKCPDLKQLLEVQGGLVKIESFLPPFVADGILGLLEGIDEDTWNLTSAQDDYVHNNIRHDFLSVKQGVLGLEDVFRVFTLLLPDSLFTFSAAMYRKDGHIAPHDDRAYTNVLMEDGSVQLCSRNIACIYYLTKDWSESDGGQLVDLEAPGGPQVHVPKYNSLIVFTIPRWHEVRAVTGPRPRYSIFGWFLEPGMLYELNIGNDETGQQQQEQKRQQQPQKDEKDVRGPQDDTQRLHQKQQQQRTCEQRQQQRSSKQKKKQVPGSQAPDQQMQSHLHQPKLQQQQQYTVQNFKKRKPKQLDESGTAGEITASRAAPENSSHMLKHRRKKKKHNVSGEGTAAKRKCSEQDD